MSFTFVEIEKSKTHTITGLFWTLVVLYLISTYALVWSFRLFLGASLQGSFLQILTIVAIALLAATIHWFFSTYQLVSRMLVAVRARSLDPGDTYHARLKNVIEEVSVAVGGSIVLEPYVISTPAMNACAVSDFSGRSAIAVTEGVLARMNRAQLESVVAHEATHIASGDSLTKSVFCGLFALHEEALKRFSGLFSSRSGLDLLLGRTGVWIAFSLMILWIVHAARRLCEPLISRQQEYRADALAVRLTRDPLSLAEALRLIAGHWRGVGTYGESLSAIFILDPGIERLSEKEGWQADLFSTHPPTEHRIEILLGMAHVGQDEFDSRRMQPPQYHQDPVPSRVPQPSGSDTRWFVWLDGDWQGPWPLERLSELGTLKPDTWIRQQAQAKASPAYQDPFILQMLQTRYGYSGPVAGITPRICPRCRVALTSVLYEGVTLDECPACRGCLVNRDQVSRVLIREEYSFSDSITRLAQTIEAIANPQRVAKRYGDFPFSAMKDQQCPVCGASMVRKFYTLAYLVEVEQCWMCGLTWFDRDELELLQCLYERQVPEDRRAV